jgi:hypothetical protein
VVVKDFAVERNHCVFIRAPHWLIAAINVDNAQPRGTERDARRNETALLVGTAMYERSNAGLQDSGGQSSRMMRVTKDPAHRSNCLLIEQNKDLPGSAAIRGTVLADRAFARM